MKLLLLADPDVALERVAAVWASLKRVAVADAAHTLHRAWGVLARALSDGETAVWTQAFTEAGILTVAIDDRALVSPPAAQPSTQLPELSSPPLLIAVCAYREELGTTVTVEKQGPSAVQRIASAGIMLTTGLPIHIGPKKETIEKKEMRSEDHMLVELVGDGYRYRLNAKEFDYTCLGEKKTYSAMLNAKQLVSSLKARFPSAGLNVGALRFLRNQSGDSPYRSLDDLDREVTWRLTLRFLCG